MRVIEFTTSALALTLLLRLMDARGVGGRHTAITFN